MRRIKILIGLVLLTVAPMVYAQTGAKRFVVTLKEDGSPAAMEQLAIRYGGRVEPLSSGSARQFAVTMTPSGAQLLGGDPRVTAAVPEAAAAPLTGRLHPASETFGGDGSSGTYSYDGSGNIVGIGADTFLYDAEGRLIRATVRGVQEDYVYDAFGNRTAATGATNCLGQSPCATPVTVSPSTNHLGGVSYDDAGSVTAASGATYSYDGTGMMTRSIAGTDDRQYVYTAEDERIAVRAGFSWNWSVRDLGGKVLREYTSVEGSLLAQSNRQWIKDYVWRDGHLLATTDATGTYHYHLDHLDTPRLITNSNRVRVAEHAYYPFGSEISITPHEAIEEPMKFTGHERDIVAGSFLTLDYMHARYYSATAGRFLSIDPVLDLSAAAKSPQSWNRYVYVLDNPMGRVDPDGRADKPKLDNIRLELTDPNDHIGLFGASEIVDVKKIDRIMVNSLSKINDFAISYMLFVLTSGEIPVSGSVVLRSGMGGEVLPMTIVKLLPRGTASVNELKALTFTTGLEHAVVRLATGERALVSGGSGGISFAEGQITRIVVHTHPYGLGAAGPSAADRTALGLLKQAYSHLIEGGNWIKFGGW